MSDEPVEDGDSGSDAEGASSSTGSEEPDRSASDAEESAREEERSADDAERSAGKEGRSTADERPGGEAEQSAGEEERSAGEQQSGDDPRRPTDDPEPTGEGSTTASDDPDDGDDRTESVDGRDSGADAEVDRDEESTGTEADDVEDEAAPPDAGGPGSGRARMGSREPPRSGQSREDPPDRDGSEDAGAAPHRSRPGASASADSGAQEDADGEESSDDGTGGSVDGPSPDDEAHPDAPGTPDDRPPVEDRESAADEDSATDRGSTTDRDAAPDDDSAPDREPRPSAHAPVGAQAPDPDEGAASPTGADASADAAGASSGTAAGTSTGGGGGGILSGGIGGSAPPDDEEMPLTEHIEEMLTRLAIVVVVAGLATLVAFPLANDVIVNMWYDVHYGTVETCRTAPQSDGCVAPHVYGPLELVLTRIRVAGLAGLLVALPLAVYQTYRFMRPGLYPHERRYFLASVPFSLVLAIVGMLFAYFVLLPLLFAYFITYTEGSADLAFQLAETMNLILLMMGMLAIVFQIPLLIMLAIMMGVTTRRWLERRRLYFWGLFLGVAVIFGPDPTGMAPFMLMATMVALFEGTLLLLRWTGR